jgi:anti-anti-sigma factor
MDILQSTSDGILTLTPNGRLDAETTDRFAALLDEVIARGDHRIVLDLAAIDYVSSVGLRALIVAAKRLTPLGGRLVLCGPQPRILKLLEISGFTAIFTVTGTRDEAAGRLL